MRTVVTAVLVAMAVLIWPVRSRLHRPVAGDRGVRSRWASWPLVAGSWRSHRPTGPGAGAAVEAELAELLALCLSAGLGPDQAIALAVGSDERGDARRRAVAAQLESPVHEAGTPSLLVLAWRMSCERGSPLKAVVGVCARTLRSADAADRRRKAAEAGPRASMWLLTALPVVGPAVAAVAGVDVVSAYSTTVAALSCAVGAGLTLVGWLWARRLLQAAVRPVRHR